MSYKELYHVFLIFIFTVLDLYEVLLFFFILFLGKHFDLREMLMFLPGTLTCIGPRRG